MGVRSGQFAVNPKAKTTTAAAATAVAAATAAAPTAAADGTSVAASDSFLEVGVQNDSLFYPFMRKEATKSEKEDFSLFLLRLFVIL